MKCHFSSLKFILIPIIFLISCKNNNKLNIDVSAIKAEVKIDRYEQDLFKLNMTKLAEGLKTLAAKYPIFVKDSLRPEEINQLLSFTTDPNARQVYDDVTKKYPELGFLEVELSDAFKHIKFYFNKFEVPKVYTFITNVDYNNRVIYWNNNLGISLDLYLGQSYYAKYGFPNYQSYLFRKESITTDCIGQVIETQFPFRGHKKDLMSYMIYHGKLLYLMDAIFPKLDDSLKIGFTGSQMKWCANNERHIWQYFIDKKLLYSTDDKSIRQFINDGPFTAPFTKESPARTGQWIGLQIVRAYMNENPEVTVQQLMNEEDVLKILTRSKFKP